MRILITGANGYIGARLIAELQQAGHELYCCVRNKWRFSEMAQSPNVHLLEVDFSKPDGGDPIPEDIDAAYFLIHSMTEKKSFEEMEHRIAKEFVRRIEKTACRQIIYLSGIVNEKELSPHLQSRLAVEKILTGGRIPVTVLRAGIIVGSGSSSFEIIRDLTEKLPVMITPRWVNTKCQPIAIRNVIQFLHGVLGRQEQFTGNYDIGGPDILTYKEMMLGFAAVRGLKRKIITVPVFTPRLSSYWLYFVTSTSYTLAKNLVGSMKVNVVCRPNTLAQDLNIELIPYRRAVELAFQKIEQNDVVSSWRDAFSAFNTNPQLAEHLTIPDKGTFTDVKTASIDGMEDQVLDQIWHIGGTKGWYYGNKLWRFRGFLDKAFGGVGLRRGRTSTQKLHAGDVLDFWRVLVADRPHQRLLLYAEMKLPGEAWLEFAIKKENEHTVLRQTATFRPIGILGRLYWLSMLPFHHFIFRGMIHNLVASAAPIQSTKTIQQ